MRGLRAPSPAMVIALIALSVALAGTGVAATFVVTSSAQIKDGAVRSADLQNLGVRGVDLANGAVGSRVIATRGVSAADLGNGAVGSRAIADGTVGDGELAAAVRGKLDLAPDADKLDGFDASGLVRVASAEDANDALVGPAVQQPVLTTQITAPGAGFLLITASSDIFGGASSPDCILAVDGTRIEASERSMGLTADANEEDCATNATRAVAAGTHTVTLLGTVPAGVRFDEATLSVLFVPFDANGAVAP